MSDQHGDFADDPNPCPFTAGSRVALFSSGFGEPSFVREYTIASVHKSGRFTLGDHYDPKQQWKPYKQYGGKWSARKTGDHGWSDREYLEPLNATTQRKIDVLVHRAAVRARLLAIEEKVKEIRRGGPSAIDKISADSLDLIERAIGVGGKALPG